MTVDAKIDEAIFLHHAPGRNFISDLHAFIVCDFENDVKRDRHPQKPYHSASQKTASEGCGVKGGGHCF